jgi:nucleoid-associated protein
LDNWSKKQEAIMNVDKIVVHQLNKNEGQQRASVDLSHDLLDVDELSVNLVQKLDASYKRTEITYAFFDSANPNVFPVEFEKYTRSQTGDSFLAFSQKTALNLKDKVEGIAPAKGGFLVFSQYEVNERDYIGIYLIRDTVGILFRKDRGKSAFIINPTEHLDLDKLAMACKIDLGQYRENDGKYLSFMKRKMNDISESFVNWISVLDRESKK